MTVQQTIDQKAAEVTERREAAIQGVDLDKVAKVAVGIEELFCEYVQKEDARSIVEEVEIHYHSGQTSIVVITDNGKLSSNDEHSKRLMRKMEDVTGIHIKDSEDIYLKRLLGRKHKINSLEAGKKDFSVIW